MQIARLSANLSTNTSILDAAMTRVCAVASCQSRDGDTSHSIHLIPKEMGLRRRWLNATGKSKYQMWKYKKIYVCISRGRIIIYVLKEESAQDEDWKRVCCQLSQAQSPSRCDRSLCFLTDAVPSRNLPVALNGKPYKVAGKQVVPAFATDGYALYHKLFNHVVVKHQGKCR